jgi:hypothetical protein
MENESDRAQLYEGVDTSHVVRRAAEEVIDRNK